MLPGSFFAFYPTNNPKNQNFEKMKKRSGDIIILPKHPINDNHVMYGSWDMKRDKHNFCHFGLSFLPRPLPPSNSPKQLKKSKLKKKKKKTPGDIIILHTVPNIMIRWCTVPEIWFATDGQAKKSDIQRWMSHLKIQTFCTVSGQLPSRKIAPG